MVKVSGVLKKGLIPLAFDRVQNLADRRLFMNDLIVVGSSTDALQLCLGLGWLMDDAQHYSVFRRDKPAMVRIVG